MRSYLNLYTHNGLFHADDVFATALLSLMCETYEVVRGGEENLPADSSDWIIFDIGGGELDHHTPECREANGTHPNTNVPYAACGLVWKKYHREILEAENCPREYIGTVYSRIENSLVLGIDASDNGYNSVKDVADGMGNLSDEQRKELLAAARIGFSVSEMIQDFNPSWQSNRSYDDAFAEAVDFARTIILNRMDSIIDAMDGRNYILQHIDYSTDHLLILEQFAPWQGVIASESRHNPKARDLWYVISPALRGGWNLQCVLENQDDRTSYRHPLPESWYGLRDRELQEASGVGNAKFCHPGGFIAGADSQEGALELAQAAMK